MTDDDNSIGLRTAIFVSGGFDSAVVWSKTAPRGVPVFFDYGQKYLLQELGSARRLVGIENLIVLRFDGKTDMPERNFRFIDQAKRAGFHTVYMGSRNLIPQFDHYGDSNFWSLKRYGRKVGVKVKLPLVGWTRGRVLDYCFYSGQNLIDSYNCYEAKEDCFACTCSNCRDLRQYFENKGLHDDIRETSREMRKLSVA